MEEERDFLKSSISEARLVRHEKRQRKYIYQNYVFLKMEWGKKVF